MTAVEKVNLQSPEWLSNYIIYLCGNKDAGIMEQHAFQNLPLYQRYVIEKLNENELVKDLFVNFIKGNYNADTIVNGKYWAYENDDEPLAYNTFKAFNKILDDITIRNVDIEMKIRSKTLGWIERLFLEYSGTGTKDITGTFFFNQLNEMEKELIESLVKYSGRVVEMLLDGTLDIGIIKNSANLSGSGTHLFTQIENFNMQINYFIGHKTFVEFTEGKYEEELKEMLK